MNVLVDRGRASARSARLLLDAGDANGAVNRAYYAMFDLARAALQAIDPTLAVAKTHATIISRFSLHMVKSKGFPRELGQALRRAHDARLVTDYSDKVATGEEAREVVDAAEQFLAAVTEAIGDGP